MSLKPKWIHLYLEVWDEMEKVELGFRGCWGLSGGDCWWKWYSCPRTEWGGKEGKSLKKRRDGTAGAHWGTSVCAATERICVPEVTISHHKQIPMTWAVEELRLVTPCYRLSSRQWGKTLYFPRAAPSPTPLVFKGRKSLIPWLVLPTPKIAAGLLDMPS